MGIIKKNAGEECLYSDLQITWSELHAFCGHPGRVKLILLLVFYDDLSMKEIQSHLLLSQSASSGLVKKVKETGLITGKEVGTSVRYSLNMEMWENMKFLMKNFLDEVDSIERSHI